ncbi:TonB-dependent receptor plug domain-containing protein [Parvularcula marina]|uniref:TonB-dependent receptor plug domain-containing protein n=1 Tax=Parvularcula marina TaxID=2292771 RepID=UPI0018F77422|nr:TonB-dependent receptor [Parvularcula marina]
MKNLLSTSVVLALLWTSVSAEEADTDVITVSGLRAQSPADVTASISVLDEEQLRLRDAPFLADSLRAVPGLGVSRSGAAGGLTQIRLRGAEANHTLVLLDGIEISDPVTGETDFGLWSGLDLSRIEIARGEQSALYGSDSIGGVIALFSGSEDGLRAAVEAGSRQTARGMISASHNAGRGYVGASLTGFTTEGVDTSGSTGEEDGSDSFAGLIRAGIEFGEGWSGNLLLRAASSTVENDSDTDFDGLLEDTLDETETDQLTFGGRVGGDLIGLNHQFRVGYTEIVRENTDNGVYTDETTGERTKLSYSPSKEWRSGDVTHRLTGLIDHEAEDYERKDTDIAFGDPNQRQEFTSLGVAGEYLLTAGRLTLNASARHDDNDGQFEDATTWRLGAAWRTDRLGRFRVSAGEGIKNPTFTELFGFYPGSFVGNPDLKPEQSFSYELGWDQDFARGSMSAVYFAAELEDEIYTAFNPDFTSTAINRVGKSERSGIELSGQYAVSDAVAIYLSGTTTQSESDDGEDEIRVPNWTASFGASWESPSKPGFVVTGALDAVGEQDDFDFGSFPSRRVTLDSYVLASATLRYPLTDHLSFTLRGDNLFDEEVTDVFGYRGPGAGLYAGFRID